MIGSVDDAARRDFARRIVAAEGYVALGMFLDANAELEDMDPQLRHETPVLILRLGIFRGLRMWDLMLAIAKALTLREPLCASWAMELASATRLAVSINAAHRVLLEAVERIPGAAGIHYNLACYECQLGDVKVARARLRHAIKLDWALKATALKDEDLAAVWQ